MKMVITLFYEESWVAQGEGIYVSAPSLLELKERLEHHLAERGLLEENEIALVFDRSRLPSWMVKEIAYEEITISKPY